MASHSQSVSDEKSRYATASRLNARNRLLSCLRSVSAVRGPRPTDGISLYFALEWPRIHRTTLAPSWQQGSAVVHFHPEPCTGHCRLRLLRLGDGTLPYLLCIRCP